MRGWWRGQPGTTVALALLCLGLSGVIYVELDEPPLSREARSMPAAAAIGTAAERAEIDVEFEMPPLAVYAEIAARPLFSPTRQPPPPEDEEAPVPQEDLASIKDSLILRGVASDGAERVALLERRATGELQRTLEGQTVDGWQVVEITSRSVHFEAGEREQVLEIEKDVSPPVPARERRVSRADDPGTEGGAPEGAQGRQPGRIPMNEDIPIPMDEDVPVEPEHDPNTEAGAPAVPPG